jgi:hypothetical protein
MGLIKFMWDNDPSRIFGTVYLGENLWKNMGVEELGGFFCTYLKEFKPEKFGIILELRVIVRFFHGLTHVHNGQ